jgi:putative transcriptional regulator
MADNSWLVIPADNSIIFDFSHAEKWQTATGKMGIKPWQLTTEAGHA